MSTRARLDSITLDEFRDTELATLAGEALIKRMLELVEIMEAVNAMEGIRINPMQAFWLWAEFSSDVGATWLVQSPSLMQQFIAFCRS